MERVSGTALLASLAPVVRPIAYKDFSNVAIDIGLLSACDGAPLPPAGPSALEEALRAAAEENAQLLVRALFELPVERDAEAGNLAVLPPRRAAVPREKPPPEAKPPTRWEKFAAEKGIAKKGKRSRLAFDPASGEDLPRFGYKRSRDPASDWLYELKAGDAPGVDHLERRALEKQRRVVNNQLNQTTNLERAAKEKEGRGGGGGGALFGFNVGEGAAAGGARKKRPREEGGARLPAGIPSIPIAEGRADALAGPGKHPKPRPSDSMGVKKAQVAAAQVSTASMGKVRTLRKLPSLPLLLSAQPLNPLPPPLPPLHLPHLRAV